MSRRTKSVDFIFEAEFSGSNPCIFLEKHVVKVSLESTSNSPKMFIFFNTDSEDSTIQSWLEGLSVSARSSVHSDDIPYDSLITVSDGHLVIQGNLSQTLDKLVDSRVLSAQHRDSIRCNSKASSILEQGKSWRVNMQEQLVFKQAEPTRGFGVCGLSAAKADDSGLSAAANGVTGPNHTFHA